MDVRLSNGRVVNLTEAQLDAGVALPADGGVHHVTRRDGRIEDLFVPELAPVVVPSAFRGGPAIELGGIGRSALPRAASPTQSAAVDAARTLIGGLERQIVRIENENLLRTREIDRLLAEMATRRQELERAYETKRNVGILGALLGAPLVGVASLIMMQNDDARLRELDASLTRVRGQKAAADQEVAGYRAMKARVTSSLEDLQRAERGLAAGLELPDRDVPRSLKKLAAAVEAFSRSELLLANLEAQIAILTELKNGALQLGLHLDQLLGELQAAAGRARASVEASQKDLGQLVRIALAGDPSAAAAEWIERTLRARVRTEVERLVHQLLEPHALPAELERALERRLVDALVR